MVTSTRITTAQATHKDENLEVYLDNLDSQVTDISNGLIRGYLIPSDANLTNSIDDAGLASLSALSLSSGLPVVFVGNTTITLASDFTWSFNFRVGGTLTINSLTTRLIKVASNNIKFDHVTFGKGVSVQLDSTLSKLDNLSFTHCDFLSGSITSIGTNRNFRLKIRGCRFLSQDLNVSNLMQFKDWAYLSVKYCRGRYPTNSFILINPSYSYTSYNIKIKGNTFTNGALFGIALAGAAEIGVINDYQIVNNTIHCNSTVNTRTLVLQNSHGGIIHGNNLSGGIVVAAGGCYDVSYKDNTTTATSDPAMRLQNCSGWSSSGNASYIPSTSKYHVTSETASITQRGRAGRSSFSGNTYYGGTRGIAMLSGYGYSIGQETFITPDADNSVGRVYIAPSAFASSIEGDQRGLAPTGVVAVSNTAANSVVDGFALQGTGGSTITAVVNGAIVTSLHGKTYHFTVDLNNNMNNIQSACDGLGTKKAVSTWTAGIAGAKLSINASPFGASGRMQDSFANGAPVPYTTPSDLTGVYAGCAIHRDGYMHCRYMPQNQLDLNEFIYPQMHDYLWQSAFFNIPLIINGAVSSFAHDLSANPRTAIGQTATGLFHVIVVDGRNADSAGCTTVELANYLLAQGCVTAFNLDGGGSSTIWYNGSVINVPSDGSERLVGQAWVFK